MPRASPRGMLSRRPLILTSIGPSYSLTARTSMRVPGSRPRRLSSRRRPASSSETPWTITFSPARHWLSGRSLEERTLPIELGPSEQLEDPRLHPLRHDVLQTLGLVVPLVPAVSEHLHQEHLQKPVMSHELERDLSALFGQLLAAVAVVLDKTLGGEAGDHLADGGRGDA